MAPQQVQRIVVAKLPSGPLDASESFRVETAPYDLVAKGGEAVVLTLYLSIDTGMRAFLDPSLPNAIQAGEVMRASGVGIVKEVGPGSKLMTGDYVYFRPG